MKSSKLFPYITCAVLLAAQSLKIASAMVVLALPVLLLLPSAAYAEDSVTVAKSSTIQISSITDLQKIGNDSAFPLDGVYLLTQDIDASTTATWNSGKGFAPIGSEADQFRGILDGDGHVLSNLTISRLGESNIGLFGYVGTGGLVKKVGIRNVVVSGANNIGAVGGFNQGTVTSCFVTGTVSGEDNVGGVVGANGYLAQGGTIATCYAAATVASDHQTAGGLVGFNEGIVIDCYATGTVAGFYDAGGLIGYNWNETGGRVSGSFWDKETSGQSGSSGGKGLTSVQMKTLTFLENAGWGTMTSDWVMSDGAYPRLAWENIGASKIPGPEPVPFAGDGTYESPYLVGTAADFALLSYRADLLDKHIQLTSDIDCSGQALCPIGDLGPFIGTFDGSGHVIRNVTMNQPESDALAPFGYIGSGGLVKNLGIENISITGKELVGGLVAYLQEGAISNCHTTGAVTGYKRYVGGLAGETFLAILTGSYAAVSVTGLADRDGGLVGAVAGSSSMTRCYATGAVTGDSFVGGFIGAGGGAVMDCYATGSVTGYSYVGGFAGQNFDSLTRCYAAGHVTGNSDVGGLVGYGGTANSCYWDTQTSGMDVSVGGMGETTTAMMSQATFAGWDFQTVWGITEGQTYPWLRGVQALHADFTANSRWGKPPFEVHFTDCSALDGAEIVDWWWQFGDGEESHEQNPTHLYVDEGTYSVTLTLTTSEGTVTATKQDYILVSNSLPLSTAVLPGAAVMLVLLAAWRLRTERRLRG